MSIVRLYGVSGQYVRLLGDAGSALVTNSHFKNTNRTRSIIIDPGPSKDRIAVRTDGQDIIFVAADGLGDDVEATRVSVHYL